MASRSAAWSRQTALTTSSAGAQVREWQKAGVAKMSSSGRPLASASSMLSWYSPGSGRRVRRQAAQIGLVDDGAGRRRQRRLPDGRRGATGAHGEAEQHLLRLRRVEGDVAGGDLELQAPRPGAREVGRHDVDARPDVAGVVGQARARGVLVLHRQRRFRGVGDELRELRRDGRVRVCREVVDGDPHREVAADLAAVVLDGEAEAVGAGAGVGVGEGGQERGAGADLDEGPAVEADGVVAPADQQHPDEDREHTHAQRDGDHQRERAGSAPGQAGPGDATATGSLCHDAPPPRAPGWDGPAASRAYPATVVGAVEPSRSRRTTV